MLFSVAFPSEPEIDEGIKAGSRHRANRQQEQEHDDDAHDDIPLRCIRVEENLLLQFSAEACQGDE
jgi:hypothetical protein